MTTTGGETAQHAFPEGLRRLLETGEFVLFLGAGVGVEAGLPAWQQALLDIADRLELHCPEYAPLLRSEATAGRYLQAAELFYLAQIPDATRWSILQAVFGKNPAITRRLRLLALTRCQGVVTTNFDDALLRARVETQQAWDIFGEADADLAAARVASRPFLVRLHGRIEVPEGLVFADRHYRNLGGRAQYVEFFRELFLNRNLVFFGFSFADPEVARLIGDMTKAVRSVFRREAYALMPAPVRPDLVEELRQAAIIVVPYSPVSAHDEAWQLLADYREGPPVISPTEFEADQVRSHLAAAYARAKGKAFRADRDRMLSALLVPLLAECGSNKVVELQELLSRVEESLALPRTFDRSHIIEALAILERDGLIVLHGSTVLIGDVSTPDELAKDANRLVDGVIARAKIRRRDTGLERHRDKLGQAVVAALALDGLHLAHTLIRAQPLDNGRLEAVVGDAVARVGMSRQHAESATGSIVELVTSPDAEEEAILGNISAVVFSTALLLADPMLADKVADPFERGAYIDASVLLPWLADGHPLQEAYISVLNAFEPGRVRVLSGYLNEVVSHRQLAGEAFEQIAGADTDRFARYASLFELHNINVFLGGFAGSLERGEATDFGEYLARVAPFDNEAQLRAHLGAKGLVVEEHSLGDHAIAGEVKAALRERGKRREDIVIRHDAAQLEVLGAIKDKGARPFLITADRALIRATSETTLKGLVRHMLLPQQVAFLARMADRSTRGLEAFSRTLWTVGASVADKVRRYYSDRVLKEYEVGLVEEIDAILAALVKDLRDDGLDLDAESARDPRSEEGRIKVFKRLDRFEPKFFQHMAEARARAERKQGAS